MRDGNFEPGLIHGIHISPMPLHRVYEDYDGVKIDANIKDVGKPIRKVLRGYKPIYLSLARDVTLEGRSWEMGVIQAINGSPGVYSGTVVGLNGGVVMYGPVPGLRIKKKMYNGLISYNNLRDAQLLSR
jgi:hypothetical protein